MKASENKAFGKCRKILKTNQEAIAMPRNISRDVQNGISKLDELLDVIAD